eukprot:1936522-Rhodomonas_salina.1
MGCRGAILEKEWDDNLRFWGMNEAARYTIKKECMRACQMLASPAEPEGQTAAVAGPGHDDLKPVCGDSCGPHPRLRTRA